jgi:hypothetical protein
MHRMAEQERRLRRGSIQFIYTPSSSRSPGGTWTKTGANRNAHLEHPPDWWSARDLLRRTFDESILPEKPFGLARHCRRLTS